MKFLKIAFGIFLIGSLVAPVPSALARGGGGHFGLAHGVSNAATHSYHGGYGHGYGRGGYGWGRGYGNYDDYVNPNAWGNTYAGGYYQGGGGNSQFDNYNRTQSQRLSQMPTTSFVQNYYWPPSDGQMASAPAESPAALSATAGRLDDVGIPPLRHLNQMRTATTNPGGSEEPPLPHLRHLSSTNSGAAFR